MFFILIVTLLGISWVFFRVLRSIFFFALLGLALGYFLGNMAQETQYQKYIKLREMTSEFSQKWEITGQIKKIAYRKDRSTVYLLMIDNFDNFDKSWSKPMQESISHVEEDGFSFLVKRRLSPSIFIEIPENLTVAIGDRVKFLGTIKKNITFPLIWYDKYSYFQWGHGYVFVSTFDRIYKADPSVFTMIRSGWEELFRKSFPQDVAGTLLGMTIGSTNYISKELKDAFIASGTAHILVVSGSNIAFVILFLSFFIKYLSVPRVLRVLVTISIVLAYIILVWSEVSVLRAGFMGILSYIVVSSGANTSSRAIFGLALIIMIIIEPLWPIYDAWFGLSFGATLGIIILRDMLISLGKELHLPSGINMALALTVGASLGSAPILLYHFGTIPLSGLLSNIIIAWLLGWILFSSIFFVILSSFSLILGYFMGILVYIPTRFVIGVTQFFQDGIIFRVPSDLAIIMTLFLLGIYSYIYVADA
jgi:ComEC/Rec2-related protein